MDTHVTKIPLDVKRKEECIELEYPHVIEMSTDGKKVFVKLDSKRDEGNEFDTFNPIYFTVRVKRIYLSNIAQVGKNLIITAHTRKPRED